MTLQLPKTNLIRRFSGLLFLGGLGVNLIFAQTKSESHLPVRLSCRVEPADYKGWHAQQLSNRWVQLIVVPQNGGRLIQVIFAGHPYLFVNPKYEGKSVAPSQSANAFTSIPPSIRLIPAATRHAAGARSFINTKKTGAGIPRAAESGVRTD